MADHDDVELAPTAAAPSARRGGRRARRREATKASRRSAIGCASSATVRLDLLGHLAQRDLAQRLQVLDLEEAVQRRRRPGPRGRPCRRAAARSATPGVRSTSTTWSARASSSSGTVSRTRTPVSSETWSLSDSRCCTLTVERTSMPGVEHVARCPRSASGARARARWSARARRSGTARARARGSPAGPSPRARSRGGSRAGAGAARAPRPAPPSRRGRASPAGRSTTSRPASASAWPSASIR